MLLMILGAYICLLSAQCLVSLSDGLTRNKFSLYNTLAAQNHPRVQPSPYDAPRDHASPHWATNCARNAELRLDPLRLLGDVLGALQTLARATSSRGASLPT
jgi:hypothetical protein